MTPRAIVLTGASRGIGRALALAYAAPGLRVGLIGRDEAKLAEVAELCRRKGAEPTPIVADVRDRAALSDSLTGFDRLGPIDLMIANAGVAAPTGGAEALERATYDEIETNLVGALNTALPVLPAMIDRRRGQIAFVSSLAAFTPLPDAPAYSASKAALLTYGLALRERLRGTGVRVSVACPGYVRTAMGERYQGWKPLSLSAENAADRIRKGLERDKAVIAFPAALAASARLSALLPGPLRRLGLSAFRFSIRDP